MASLDLSETVKWSEVHGYQALPTGALEGHAFDVKLGDNEVMILKAMHYWWYGLLQPGINVGHFGLWRKTDSDPPANVWVSGAKTDMVWHGLAGVLYAVGQSIRATEGETITFPDPLVLIRPPRLVMIMELVQAVNWSMRIYYVLRKVSDEQLAKLMVKDHA